MTRVALLWHMHQPYYKDPVTGDHLLPWVRLHALKDYLGMAGLLEEFPDVRVTFNLVPSLLTQIEEYAADAARDRSLDLSIKPADQLGDEETLFVLQNFFHAQRQRMIEPYPRYAELLKKRGDKAPVALTRDLALAFSTEDLRDLQVWHKIAWLDPEYLARDERVRTLVGKDRHFTETDKATLRSIELEILNAVLPAYRAAADRGQVELSTSPFYHPILPLLCDTDIYKRTHPLATLPRRRFQRPEDALEQLVRARAYHEQVFGQPPAGLWPPEGSVSDAMVPLAIRSGFAWMATDEAILARSLGVTFTRDSHGHVDRPEVLYRPYVVGPPEARISCAFRDHMLSDLIGFTYASWPSDRAADDFVGRLVHAGRRFSERAGGEDALIPIILDGENAWEHFEGGGRPFLRALYGRLSHHPEIATVTMGQACSAPGRELASVFPGSWIDANFYVWIGHRDDQKAWDQLAAARDAIDQADGILPGILAQAREEILIAEGSDWFWWYGDDRSSDHDQEFDDLFRRHLRNAYRLLGKPIPDELSLTNISTDGHGAREAMEPLALVTPTLDGEDTSYFEWLGAGRFEVVEITGAMHQTTRRERTVDRVLFGFDREGLHLRLDGPQPMRDVLAHGLALSIEFLVPSGLKFVMEARDGAVRGAFWERRDPTRWAKRAPEIPPLVAAGSLVEISLPLAALMPAQGSSGPPRELQFFVTVRDVAGIEVERHPSRYPIAAIVPDGRFDALHWRV